MSVCKRLIEDDSLRKHSAPMPRAPALRASERPMAIACLRLVTFFPEHGFIK